MRQILPLLPLLAGLQHMPTYATAWTALNFPLHPCTAYAMIDTGNRLIADLATRS